MMKKRKHLKNRLAQYITNKDNNSDYEIEKIIPKLFGKEKDIVSAIYSTFIKETNIPVTLPIFTTFSFISAFLLKNNITYSIDGYMDGCLNDLWIVNLAPSGSSKTYSLSRIINSIPEIDESKIIEPNFSHCSGAMAFCQELKEKNNGFYFADECAQVLKQIESINSPMHEVKKYLLLTYDHSKIQRKNKKENIEIEKPALTLYWINTIQSFIDSVSTDSLSDGFSQRFLYVYTEKDMNRHFKEFPLYSNISVEKEISSEFKKFFSNTFHKNYVFNKDMVEMFKIAFKEIVETRFNNNFDESFYRRVMFKTFTYAVIYHLILNKNTVEIDEEDMEYALRVSLIHLYSIQRILSIKTETEFNGIDKTINNSMNVYKKAKEKNQPVTSRILQQQVWGLKKADDAKFMKEFIDEKLSDFDNFQDDFSFLNDDFKS